MEEISLSIKHYLKGIREGCPSFDEEQRECLREGGCACYKTAEIMATIRALIPEEYRNSNLFSYDGYLEGKKRVIEPKDVTRIKTEMWQYLYKTPFNLTIENMTRSELNRVSALDARFKKGCSLVIHGEQKQMKDASEYTRMRTIREPKGKTLLASIVLMDAIWRRTSPDNIARTYDWVSFLQLRQDLKKSDRSVYDYEDADWLVIDDICQIERGNAAAWTRETLDDFMVSRHSQGKPTILVFDFDVNNVSLSDVMGSGIAKIVESHNTTRIRV